MAEFHEEKLRIMEDEMNRFEAEIAVPVPPHIARAVIGANTYNQVQRRLEEQQMPEFHPGMFCPPILNIVPGFVGIPPPPPPPPPLLIPHQLAQRPMREMMAPPNYNVNPPQRQQFPQAPSPAPQPPTSTTNNAVLSVAPLLYNPNRPMVPKMKPSKVMKPVPTTTFDMDTYATFQNELSQLAQPAPKKTKVVENKYESLHAKDMAAKVKASAMNAAVATVSTAVTVDEPPTTSRKKSKKNKLIRMAGGQTWEDGSLAEWEDDDYRIFCGDLGNDVTDEILTRTFSKYTSFLKAKVVRDKRSNKTKGFGFVSFKDPQDFIKAMKEMNGRYVGSRPIKLRKSSWKSRNLDNVRKKEKEKNALIGMLTGR